MQDKGNMLVNLLIMENLPKHVTPGKYVDLFELQAAIGDECPVCFTGEALLEEAVKQAQEKMKQ